MLDKLSGTLHMMTFGIQEMTGVLTIAVDLLPFVKSIGNATELLSKLVKVLTHDGSCWVTEVRFEVKLSMF
jgi:hypothetical protein